MTTGPATTVAHLIYERRPAGLTLGALASDLRVLHPDMPPLIHEHRRLNGSRALIDHPMGRIVLDLSETIGPGRPRACLTVAIGQRPGPRSDLAPRPDLDHSSRVLVERIASRHRPLATHWHFTSEALRPPLIELLLARLPNALAVEDAAEATLAQVLDPQPAPAALIPANDPGPLADPQVDEAARIRTALFQPDPDRPTTALRLAAHTINATMIVIAMPVGMAAMTYTMLRGENLTASARMLALLGLAVGAQNAGLLPVN
jgi:hypothetical protein